VTVGPYGLVLPLRCSSKSIRGSSLEVFRSSVRPLGCEHLGDQPPALWPHCRVYTAAVSHRIRAIDLGRGARGIRRSVDVECCRTRGLTAGQGNRSDRNLVATASRRGRDWSFGVWREPGAPEGTRGSSPREAVFLPCPFSGTEVHRAVIAAQERSSRTDANSGFCAPRPKPSRQSPSDVAAEAVPSREHPRHRLNQSSRCTAKRLGDHRTPNPPRCAGDAPSRGPPKQTRSGAEYAIAEAEANSTVARYLRQGVDRAGCRPHRTSTDRTDGGRQSLPTSELGCPDLRRSRGHAGPRRPSSRRRRDPRYGHQRANLALDHQDRVKRDTHMDPMTPPLGFGSFRRNQPGRSVRWFPPQRLPLSGFLTLSASPRPNLAALFRAASAPRISAFRALLHSTSRTASRRSRALLPLDQLDRRVASTAPRPRRPGNSRCTPAQLVTPRRSSLQLTRELLASSSTHRSRPTHTSERQSLPTKHEQGAHRNTSESFVTPAQATVSTGKDPRLQSLAPVEQPRPWHPRLTRARAVALLAFSPSEVCQLRHRDMPSPLVVTASPARRRHPRRQQAETHRATWPTPGS